MASVVDGMINPSNISVPERSRALLDRLTGIWGTVSDVSSNLPPETLRWRIQNWLSAGQGRVERELEHMKVSYSLDSSSFSVSTVYSTPVHFSTLQYTKIIL